MDLKRLYSHGRNLANFLPGEGAVELTIFWREILYHLDYNRKTPAVPPIILLKAWPAEIPEELYQSAAACRQLKNRFSCSACGEQVMLGSLPEDSEPRVQLCRCFLVEHFQPKLFATSHGWQTIRRAYEEESLNPAPDNPMVVDPFSGAPIGITKKGRKFLSKKWGFHRPVQMSQGGRLLTTSTASIYTHPESKTLSVHMRTSTVIDGDALRKIEGIVRSPVC